MCPPTSTSPSVTIGNDWNDDQIFSCLFKSKRGHPLPTHLSTDVNPFNIEPWRAPEKTWFLWNSEQSGSSGGHEARTAGCGYWELRKNCQKMFSSELHEGSKIYWEFYVGVVPYGRRTGWLLLEYKKEPKEHHEDAPFSFSSLCILYRQQIDSPLSKAESNATGAKDAEADHLQSILFGLEDDEENIEQSPANSIQVDRDDDQEKVPMSDISRDTGSEYSGDLPPYHLDEDFLELKDFDDAESSSSCSENSSTLSKFSDDYFDPEALLLALKNGNNQITGEDGKDRNQTGLGTTGSDEAVKELRRPASDAGGDHEEKPVRSSSNSKEKRGGKREKRAASRSPRSSGSSHGPSSNFGRRMAKYCCFGSPP